MQDGSKIMKMKMKMKTKTIQIETYNKKYNE